MDIITKGVLNHPPTFSTMRPAVLEMWKKDAHVQLYPTNDSRCDDEM